LARREIGEAKLVRELRIILLPAALAAAEPDGSPWQGDFCALCLGQTGGGCGPSLSPPR